MILSKFRVDIRSPPGRSCIRDCQNMHRSIMRLFHCTRKDGNIQYRFIFCPKKSRIFRMCRRE